MNQKRIPQKLGSVEDLKTIFSSNLTVISHNAHESGRETFVAKTDSGEVIHVTFFPKWIGKMNVDIYRKGESHDQCENEYYGS